MYINKSVLYMWREYIRGGQKWNPLGQCHCTGNDNSEDTPQTASLRRGTQGKMWSTFANWNVT